MVQLIDTSTKLGDVPREWLRFIEPKIIRRTCESPIFKDDCWVWVGYSKHQQGIPMYPSFKCPVDMFDLRKGKAWTNGRRYVAELFFGEIPTHLVVYMKCSEAQCLNPRHMIISTKNDPQFRF